MTENLAYRVSAREIVDLVSAMRQGRLTRSPFFQRNLVWRETHKREFIETILSGLPFPQIFLARGRINVETMEAYSCVVDGQQRLTAIEEYISGKFSAAGQFYNNKTPSEKENFLKYKVAVIDFDLDEKDERLKEIFKRLNRTYYSLSTVEKIASEYSGSEFLVAARVLCGDFLSADDAYENGEMGEEEDNPFLVDPSLPKGTLDWARSERPDQFSSLIGGDNIFTNYESARQVPLMFVLTIMSTLLYKTYFNRTDKVREYLEEFNDNFPDRDEIVTKLEIVGKFVESAELERGSFWLRKTNFFTLAVEIAQADPEQALSPAVIARLHAFAANPPDRYVLAQREAVNSRRERVLRGQYFREHIIGGETAAVTLEAAQASEAGGQDAQEAVLAKASDTIRVR